MTERSATTPRFDWQWSSAKGKARTENRDAAGILSHATYTIALIGDASSRGEHGLAFIKAWIQRTLAQLDHTMPSRLQTMRAMQSAQKVLRAEGFNKENASYAALILPHGSGGAFGLFCGDCCIGYLNRQGQTEWLSRPHTGAALCGSSADAPGLQHIVTQSLKVPRFVEPECIDINLTDSHTWILATDGYHCISALPTSSTEDDRSAFILGLDCGVTTASDISNIYVAVDGVFS